MKNQNTPQQKKHLDGLPCTHSSVKKFPNNLKNCKDCGVSVSNTGVHGYKSQKQCFGAFFNPYNFYKSICKKRLENFDLKQSPFNKNRRQIIDSVFDLAQKLKLSLKSIHLGVLFLDYCVTQESAILKQLPLYAAVALFLSAKAIEKDERIPFIPQLRKAASPLYSQDEYKRAENKMIGILKFNLQIPTLLDFLDFYTAQGVLFSDDKLDGQKISDLENGTDAQTMSDILSPPPSKENYKDKNIFDFKSLKYTISQQKLNNLIQNIEKEVRRLSNAILKDPDYLNYDFKILSAASIALVRKNFELSPIWHPQLEEYSGVQFQEFTVCMNQFMQKFEVIFKNSPLGSPSTTTTLTPKSPFSGNQNFSKILNANSMKPNTKFSFQSIHQQQQQQQHHSQQQQLIRNSIEINGLGKSNGNTSNFFNSNLQSLTTQNSANKNNENMLNAQYAAYTKQYNNQNNSKAGTSLSANSTQLKRSFTTNISSHEYNEIMKSNNSQIINQNSTVQNYMGGKFRKPSFTSSRSSVASQIQVPSNIAFQRQTSLTLKYL